MQLNEIIKDAALMLGKEDIVKYLDSLNQDEDYDDGYDDEYDDWYEEEENWEEIYGDGEFGASAGEDSLDKVNLMVNLANLVINELACTYLPLITEEQMTFSNGKAYYKDFKKKAVKILKVYNLFGQEVDFDDKTEYVLVQSNGNQSLIVEYQYSPDNYALEDEIGYTEKDISARVIAYGVASEVCISEGAFDLAVMHHKRFVDEIALLTMPKNTKIKQRSWR